jgi:hypothetical protein
MILENQHITAPDLSAGFEFTVGTVYEWLRTRGSDFDSDGIKRDSCQDGTNA